uniref:Integrase, catalytic region, zinc finger, CCHC-type, peptidase aspartic, catalytic n=1 Tax=Tanacetum cinerariifolium TaxID=118510 RepID=A0A699HC09_TANCI|nr:hypothetical protein [Tanacetum cinerariifolium]
MSTQQDIYAAGSDSRPPILNKENYVPWSSRLLWYAKSRPNGKLIHNSILNGPYVRRMIHEPDDANREVTVTKPFICKQTINSLKRNSSILKLMIKQMMKGSNIGIQEKKAKLFNEWERFTSNKGESLESYYHRFLKLMNDLKRNKHFLEKIASNLKFLNNLQPEWSRHVTIVHQTKDLHTADYTQLYDFLKYNQKENYLQQPMPNPKDITDPTTAMNMELALMAKAFKLNYSIPTNNNQRISSNPKNRQITQPGMNMGQDKQLQMVGGNGGNQFRKYAENPASYNDVIGNQVIQNAVQNPRVQSIGNQTRLIGVQRNGNQNQIGNGNLVAARAEGNAAGQNGNQIRCYNCRGEEAGIQLQAEEYDLIAVAADLDEIEEVNENCILMANLLQASTSGTQTDSAPIYDSDGSAEVHENCDENCDDNEIFNMFTQEEQYIELLKPIPESHQVPQIDNDVISEDTSVEQGGETVEQHPTNFEETRALYESLYHNLAIEVEKVNSINRKLKETNVDLTTELARFKNQSRCFEISQEKYDNLERCYQQSVYQEQCLSKKINDLHLSTEETLQLAQEIHEKMKQLNKEIKPANYIKINHLLGVFVPQTAMSHEELYFSNISKTANVSKSISIPNDDFLDDTTPSVARKFLNEEAAKFVGDFKSLANEADASLAKHKALELEIERLLKAVVSQDIMIIVQNESVVDTSNLQIKLERTKERFENCIIKKEYEYAKLWNDWYNKCDECKYDKISYDKAYKDMQQKIERLQAQLGDLKGKSKDTSCVSDTQNLLSQKLENENMELEFQDMSENTKFVKQPIMENLLKVGKTNALSKPVTSNSVSAPQESKGVDNTKTRRPQPRSNTKHDMVSSPSKSSQSENKDAEVEEHHRNLLLSKNKKHMSSAFNTPRCDEDRLELMKLMIFLLPKIEKVGIGFWTTVAVKKVNDVTRLQALADKKKVVVTKVTIREDLCLDDAEGVECLPNEEIFAELARMGYE